MWPFKKKPAEGIAAVPEEIQDYYAAERRGRTGIAWLLALATLLTTLALAAALFFGGRWVYRKVHHSATSPITQTASPTTSPFQPTGSKTPTKKHKTVTTKPTHKTVKKVVHKVVKKPVVKAVAVKPTKNLANTGAGNIMAVFAATTVVASLGHFVVARRRS